MVGALLLSWYNPCAEVCYFSAGSSTVKTCYEWTHKIAMRNCTLEARARHRSSPGNGTFQTGLFCRWEVNQREELSGTRAGGCSGEQNGALGLLHKWLGVLRAPRLHNQTQQLLSTFQSKLDIQFIFTHFLPCVSSDRQARRMKPCSACKSSAALSTGIAMVSFGAFADGCQALEQHSNLTFLFLM